MVLIYISCFLISWFLTLKDCKLNYFYILNMSTLFTLIYIIKFIIISKR